MRQRSVNDAPPGRETGGVALPRGEPVAAYNRRMKERRILLAAFLSAAIVLALGHRAGAEPLKPGDAAPDAPSVDQDGRPVNLSRLYGPGWTLVYFYPKADTPGCTAEACSLRDAFSDLT